VPNTLGIWHASWSSPKPSDLRPISLLHVLAKSFLGDSIRNLQFGGLKGPSTTTH